MQSHALSRRTSTDIYRSNRLSKCKNKTSLNNSFYWHMRIKLYILIFPAHQKISMMYKFYFSNSRTPTYPQSTKIILKFACVQLQSLKRQIIILHCIRNSRVFKRILNKFCCTIFSCNTELNGKRPSSLGPSDKGGREACTPGTNLSSRCVESWHLRVARAQLI